MKRYIIATLIALAVITGTAVLTHYTSDFQKVAAYPGGNGE